MKWLFIVFCLYLASLFFHEQRIPGSWAEIYFEHHAPENLILSVDTIAFGFLHGLHVRGLRIYDSSMKSPTQLLAGADEIFVNPFSRHVRIAGARYTRLPDSYYAPENHERNARVECEFPAIGDFTLTLTRTDILSIQAERITADVSVKRHRIEFSRIHLDWPDADRRMAVIGFCYLDLDRQEIYGEVEGEARQAHIRPMLVTIDVPVSLPYMDGFTEVPVPCPSWCAWKVDLVRADLDLWLDLHPTLGRYNTIPMKRADGRIHLHNYTRGDCLNYRTTVGPITAKDLKDRPLEGTVTIIGTNGYNVVSVKAKSAQPIADVLRIGGFTGEYVDADVVGESECDLEFRFPRAMTNNYEVLNGRGRVIVRNGQLMRMKGFRGLIAAMPNIAPAVTWFSDATQASGDYVIENGIVRTENTYIEGPFFSIKMYGFLDTVKGQMDFTVRVQFTKKDSLVGKVLHPLTWPFTKLLLEFRLTGSPENPHWQYVSVIDRVLEVVK